LQGPGRVRSQHGEEEKKEEIGQVSHNADGQGGKCGLVLFFQEKGQGHNGHKQIIPRVKEVHELIQPGTIKLLHPQVGQSSEEATLHPDEHLRSPVVPEKHGDDRIQLAPGEKHEPHGIKCAQYPPETIVGVRLMPAHDLQDAQAKEHVGRGKKRPPGHPGVEKDEEQSDEKQVGDARNIQQPEQNPLSWCVFFLHVRRPRAVFPLYAFSRQDVKVFHPRPVRSSRSRRAAHRPKKKGPPEGGPWTVLLLYAPVFSASGLSFLGTAFSFSSSPMPATLPRMPEAS